MFAGEAVGFDVWETTGARELVADVEEGAGGVDVADGTVVDGCELVDVLSRKAVGVGVV